jgi:hypothetical protein
MKRHLLFTFFLTFTLLLCTISIRAQYYEEKHDQPLKGSWYPQGSKVMTGELRSVNPMISDIIIQINPDSIKATIQHMQDYGSRFMLLDSRKTIANWIADRFWSYGYTDVRLDSFLNYSVWGGNIDTTWQYNVVCTVTGHSAPSEIYVIGGHYDSFCSGDPMVYAPGANDNASAVAATLEMARVMKANGFIPEATVKFTLFAAEELGLWGSRYTAEQAYVSGEDIRMMMNMDMISNNPDSIKQVKIYRYYSVEWAGDLAADVFTRYTDLEIFYPQNLAASGSDSYPFWAYGFPVFYLEEMNFSSHWHQPSDTVGNCNTSYCAEIARGCLAMLLEQELLPYPQGVMAESTKENITVSWKPTENLNVAGCNIYRSGDAGISFEKINPEVVADSFYVDVPPLKGREYLYYVKTVNESAEESLASLQADGAVFAFNDTLLVVAALEGDAITPDSIRNYYDAVFDTIPYTWVDHSLSNHIDLGSISRHKNILWLLNSRFYDFPDEELGLDLITFFNNGGNMMFAGYNPSYFLTQNNVYPWKVPDISFFSHFFKVDSVNRKVNCFMNRAYPVADDYDTLRVDSALTMVPNHQGQIYSVEVFTPTVAGKVIYRFNSPYPPTTTSGAMQDKPVGLEYMGEDFKTILLSFPLNCLDTADARKLMKYVMEEKFSHPTGIIPAGENTTSLLRVFPNPSSGETTIQFRLDTPSDVRLTVFDMQGKRVAELLKGTRDAGVHHVRFPTGSLRPGIYSVILRTERFTASTKLIIIP